MKDNFIDVPFSVNNLDRYYIRSSILRAFKDNLKFFRGELLDVGCGQMPYRDFILHHSAVNKYVGIDIDNALIYEKNIKPDYTWDGTKMPFNEATFQTLVLTEVLEHVPEPVALLRECKRVMKMGGIIFITVPFLWNLHEVPRDEYRYTPFALDRILKEAGFQEIKVVATGGWNASLGQMLGLWVRRSKMSRRKRMVLSYILKPIISSLFKTDIVPTEFREGQMLTSLYAIAVKG